MSQTSYSTEMTTAVDGMPGDAAGAPQVIDSYNNPVDEIKFGVAVQQVSGDDDGIELPDSSGAKIRGIAVRDLTEENGSAAADNTYPADSRVAVMKKGRIWVPVEEAVSPSSDVYTRYTAGGGNTQLGAFRTDADSSKALQITQARFLTSTSGAGRALLEINLP